MVKQLWRRRPCWWDQTALGEQKHGSLQGLTTGPRSFDHVQPGGVERIQQRCVGIERRGAVRFNQIS